MKKISGVILFSLLLCGCPALRSNQDERILEAIRNLPPTQEVQQSMLLADDMIQVKCDEILDTLVRKGIDDAFRVMKRSSLISAAEMNQFEKTTKKQLMALGPRFGKVIGYEQISNRQIGQSVAECVYIVKYEKHLLRWRFYFYKPDDKWMLNSFFWDDQIQSLL